MSTQDDIEKRYPNAEAVAEAFDFVETQIRMELLKAMIECWTKKLRPHFSSYEYGAFSEEAAKIHWRFTQAVIKVDVSDNQLQNKN